MNWKKLATSRYCKWCVQSCLTNSLSDPALAKNVIPPIDDWNEHRRFIPIVNRQSTITNRQRPQCLRILGSSSAGIISKPGLPAAVAPSPNEKSAVALPLAGTVTCIVFSVPVAPPSFHAATV